MVSRGSGEAVLGREAGGGGAGGDAQLAVNCARVAVNRVAADEEPRSDLSIGQALGQETQHVGLARSQPEWDGSGRGRRGAEAGGEGVGASERRDSTQVAEG